ncbi:MAG: hypothetical protein LBV17_01890 [Treponema sp.]|jgi:hypothetical protein|nr:hypothetical protein [Treponema sp.]
MNNIDFDRKKIGLKHCQYNFFLGVSILWLVCCFALLIPLVRNLIIWFGEALVHRPLNHPVWHARFIFCSISAIPLYIICFGFFLTNLYSPTIAGKKIDIFAISISLIAVFAIMYKANWVFSDDHEYISTTAVNKYVPFDSGGGRFMPFRYFQYNLPLFIFRCLGINTGLPVEVHFAVISIFFIVTFFCLYFLFTNIEPVKTVGSYSVFNRFFACTFFLLGSSFSSVFLSLIYPETQVIMLFSLFMLMYYKALRTDKIRYYSVAFLSAVFSTYCKEPVFGVFLVIAFVNHFFGYNKQSKREKLFYITLAANGILFLILYYFLSFRNATGFYNAGRVSISGFKFLLSIFTGNPVLVIMFCFGLIRLYSVIVRKERDRLFYDSLLFAGIAYVFAIFVLHLNADYYFLPSIILFLPSFVFWIKYLFEKKRALAAAMFIFLLPLCTYNFGRTLLQVRAIWQERQEFMPYIANLLSEYNNGRKFIWYESDNRITDNTFYIDARNWRKHIENAFLNYHNKSEGMDFFVLERNMDNITTNQNILFFYPVDNDQGQPMQDTLVNFLLDNNFTLYKDSYGVLIYKQHSDIN